MMEKVLIIFSTCKPVKGFRRSLICDLVRHKFVFIPNTMYDFIYAHNRQKLDLIRTQYSPSEYSVINEYIEFLLDNEFAFLCDIDEVDYFPESSDRWDYPAIITNGIIDIDEHTEHDFVDIFSQFEKLGCKHLLIRSCICKPIFFWEGILNYIQGSRYKSIEIINRYSSEYSNENIVEMLAKHGRIRSLTLSSSEHEKAECINGCMVFYVKNAITSSQHCGFISPKYFNVNIELFYESLAFNNCLNRKISIDAYGIIKNCPSIQTGYGNINSTSLLDVVDNNIFKSYWYINKDSIEICNICEFRYICTDCRAFINQKENLLSKPEKCSYDPISASWNK